ncbi:malectin [Crotalus adamanteus]|uniref:Malectin n=1 Tax=Crotalus adamanteus TaxID=8729 RepID=A0AAW1ANW8_CROAD
MKLPILRSNPEDQILYQTERYNEETFGYEVPIKEEGDYVLVLKFAEVYFAQSQQKVFDVRLNGHMVVKDLDIFDRVGHSTAHDEIIPISIKKGKLSVQGEVSTFTGKLNIEFVKGYYDNPKICALYVLAGTADDVPKLQPHPGLEKKEEEEDEEEYEDGSSPKKQANKNRVQSGPRTPNPYASDNSSLMFPILVAFGKVLKQNLDLGGSDSCDEQDGVQRGGRRDTRSKGCLERKAATEQPCWKDSRVWRSLAGGTPRLLAPNASFFQAAQEGMRREAFLWAAPLPPPKLCSMGI